MQNKPTFRQRFRSSSLMVRAAVAEMVGRTDEAESTYGKIRARFGMYKSIATYDVSRTSYALARSIYFANKYKDSKTGVEYGEEYLLGAPLGKPIINIAAAFALGAPVQIVENNTVTNAADPNQDDVDLDNPEPDNPTVANVNQWLDEQRNFLYMAARNEFRDGDTFVVMEDDGSMMEIPPEDVDIIQNVNNPNIIDGYDIYTTIDDPEDKTGIKTITYVDEIRRVYRRRMIQDESGNRTEVPGTLTEYRSAEDGGYEERALPVVHFANEKEARSLYGVSEFQSLYFLMANYHAVLAAAIKGNIYNSSAVPVVQGVENMKQFLEQNFRKDADGNYILKWDSDKMLVVGKGGQVQMLQADGTASDAQTLLEVLFWLIAQNSETPEFAFGTAVQSSKASVSEQTPMLIKKAIRKQGQLEAPIRQLIDLYIERMANLRPEEFDAETQYSIDMPDILDKDLNVNIQIVNTLLEKGIITEETAAIMLNIGKYVKDLAKELAKAKLQKEARNPIPTDVFGQPVNNKDDEDEEVSKVAKQAEIDEMKKHDDTRTVAETLEKHLDSLSLSTIQEMNPHHDSLGRFASGPGKGGSGGTNPKEAGPTESAGGLSGEQIDKYSAMADNNGSDYYRSELMERVTKDLGYDGKPGSADSVPSGVESFSRGWQDKAHIDSYMKDSNPRLSIGIWGSGLYFGPTEIASSYAKDGLMTTAFLKKGTRIGDAQKLREEIFDSLDTLQSNQSKQLAKVAKITNRATKAKVGFEVRQAHLRQNKLFGDIGAMAAIKGYQALKAPTGEVIVLDRSAVVFVGGN